ncbi:MULTISPECIES: ABC transporter ATP-binding protein [unclassified Plantactinospora]|uniref:ABC transporter ATP-binding protein n=1 Tax=unclassified Plantactinospora TaxID=2631981 RepID=UPI000D161CD1|nr:MULTISPECIES: ABC transporter ATP-binding protein [unclassified Plantactinospora]AVT29800.1 glycine/betaine ABC transporter [Plantactinospora sp. BC1]AVT36306.1 glycine/betaine ABC transporter [Plantactinospora sp. BB1]
MDVTPEAGSAGPAGTTGAAAITLDQVRKQYPDGTVAVGELSLEVKAGELVVLIGPSGCGKSTVLRMINRLIEPTSGRILLGDEDVTRADPVQLRRRIGYVIQNVGLFPHQTIATNVGTVPRLSGWSRARIAARTAELLDLVGLDPTTFGPRYPHELSGGQRQRVGVARALAADPVVLLMDEPFSAVDPIARARLQEEFLRLQAEVRKTIVLVTHDLDEAVRLGDRIVVLSQGGRLEQYAGPATLLGEPASAFVREFVGTDRAIRRLAVTPVTRELLRPIPPDAATTAGLPTVPLGSSLYDALAVLLRTNSDDARVTDEGGELVGTVSRHQILSIDYPADPVGG